MVAPFLEFATSRCPFSILMTDDAFISSSIAITVFLVYGLVSESQAARAHLCAEYMDAYKQPEPKMLEWEQIKLYRTDDGHLRIYLGKCLLPCIDPKLVERFC